MHRTLLALAAAGTLTACATPGPTADAAVYDEPVAVTGSHVPRKTPPSGVESIDGDAVRAQGQLAPTRGVTGQKGQ